MNGTQIARAKQAILYQKFPNETHEKSALLEARRKDLHARAKKAATAAKFLLDVVA